MAPVALAGIWIGAAPFDALIVLLALGLVIEWAALCRLSPWQLPGGALGAVLGLAAALTVADRAGLALAALALGCAALRASARPPLLGWGVVYIGLPMVALLWLRAEPGGRDLALFLVAVVWASDVGAYAAGRSLRGPKLAPRLSPGKTWSGAAGGVLAVLLVAAALPPHRWGLALGLGVICQAGDLLESAIKRHVGVKDSGRWIPGHGGLLDRLDGLMAAAPVAALAMLIARGGSW